MKIVYYVVLFATFLSINVHADDTRKYNTEKNTKQYNTFLELKVLEQHENTKFLTYVGLGVGLVIATGGICKALIKDQHDYMSYGLCCGSSFILGMVLVKYQENMTKDKEFQRLAIKE